MTPYGDKNWPNIVSGKGLLPDATKPLPEPMLANNETSPASILYDENNDSIIATSQRGQCVEIILL